MAAVQAACITPGGTAGAFQVAAGDSVALQDCCERRQYSIRWSCSTFGTYHDSLSSV